MIPKLFFVSLIVLCVVSLCNKGREETQTCAAKGGVEVRALQGSVCAKLEIIK